MENTVLNWSHPVLAGMLLVPLALGILGVLWIPGAAVSCALLSRRARRPAGDLAGAGLVHSLLLLLPWVYLVVRMSGVTAPPVMGKVLAALGYAGLYTVWAVVFVGYVIEAARSMLLSSSGRVTTDEIGWVLLLSLLAALSACTLLYSARKTWRRYIAGGVPVEAMAAATLESYLEPWGWLLGWTVVIGGVMLLIIGSAVSGT